MKGAAIVVALAVLGAGVLPAQDLPEWVLQLSRIKRQAKAQLERLPNFACLETINRFERQPRSQVVKPVDTIRLEVAFVGGKELVAPVGASAGFMEMDMTSMGKGGAIGTGAFSAIAQNVFVHDNSRPTGHGEEPMLEHRALRFDYVIPSNRSGYVLQSGGVSGIVGLEGSFWADAENLQVLRVREHATEIPLGLDVQEADTTVTYQKVRIGASDVLMPQTAESILVTQEGLWRRNFTEFTNCREYVAESVIRFDTPEPPAKKK